MNNNLIGKDFNTGIYIRLSQEDKDKKYESDSESVINQKELLRGYVKNNNFNLEDPLEKNDNYIYLVLKKN